VRWVVKEDKNVGATLKKAFSDGEISLDDIEVIRVWARVVMQNVEFERGPISQ